MYFADKGLLKCIAYCWHDLLLISSIILMYRRVSFFDDNIYHNTVCLKNMYKKGHIPT